MKNSLRTIQIAILCFFFLTLTVSSGRAHPPLKFCVYPSKSPKIIVSIFEPLAKLLSEATGHPVTLVTAPDRKTFQERALTGEYDLALACVACYFELHEKKGYVAIARGEPSFTGGLFVRKDSPVTQAEQLLQGKRIGAVKEYSYAGFLFWHAYLVENNLQTQSADPYVFLGNQDSVVYAILNHKIDAGFVRTDFLNNRKMQPLKSQLRLILKSPAIPHFPFIVSPDLDKNLVQQITESLTSLTADSAVGKKLFNSTKIDSIRAVSDSDYDSFKESYSKALHAWTHSNK